MLNKSILVDTGHIERFRFVNENIIEIAGMIFGHLIFVRNIEVI